MHKNHIRNYHKIYFMNILHLTIFLQLPDSPSNKPQKTNHLVDNMDLSIHTCVCFPQLFTIRVAFFIRPHHVLLFSKVCFVTYLSPRFYLCITEGRLTSPHHMFVNIRLSRPTVGTIYLYD